MVGFILSGHGQFARGLASAVEMVAGSQPAFKVIPFDNTTAATYADDLRRAVCDMRAENDGVLVFVDMLGGTPFNQTMAISQDVDGIEVVGGANLPMLVELLFKRRNASLADLAEMAVQVGRTGIAHKAMCARACD